MYLPDTVLTLLEKLEQAGVEGYVVGGCVRDALMGDQPHDYDIAAAAPPQRLCEIFADYRLIKTGMQHGTVTVLAEGQPYEITAFRVDGSYSDGRHPDAVSFCGDIRADLARRDFTINAMAYHPQRGLVDPFGGQSDLQKGILRAVGQPHKRFTEDALRILRLLRFAARYGFTVEADTAQAALHLRERLDTIARERVFSELMGMLMGAHVGDVLLQFAPILFQLIPELAKAYAFPQNTPYHQYDVWRHIVGTVACAKKNADVRLTMLLHDVAKPQCFCEEKGVAHFPAHPAVGAAMAEKILARMRCDRATRERVVRLITYHDVHISPDAVSVKKWLNRLGETELFLLLDCQAADASAKSDAYRAVQLQQVAALRKTASALLDSGACFRLCDLAVNGKDLLALGAKPGREMGALLQQLLDEVMEEKIQNTPKALENRAKSLLATGGCGAASLNV